ncbi:hypothetical protein LC76P1_00049 [Lysinibacillus phage LC76P1]|nr:hypothetical protein LC76P1_00049 [Lysinibacillus phage LC76P1]
MTKQDQLRIAMFQYALALHTMNTIIEEQELPYDKTWDEANQLYDELFEKKSK